MSAATLDMDPELLAEMIAAGLIESPSVGTVESTANHADDAEIVATLHVAGDESVIADEISESVIADEIIASAEITTEPSIETAPVDLHDGLEQEIADQESREAIYATQKSTMTIVEETPKAKSGKSSKSSKPREPRVSKPKIEGAEPRKRESRVAQSGSLAHHVAKIAGEEIELLPGHSVKAIDLVENLPVKIREKAANIFDHLHGAKRLSVFSKQAIELLKTEGEIKSKRLVELYSTGDDPYSIGTARSQAQQLSSLLRTLCVTDASGKLNADSAIWPRLNA